MPEDKIQKLDAEELTDVTGGRGRTLFSHPYCRVCGKRMAKGPSMFVFVCVNAGCSRFQVITPVKDCDWK